MQEKQFKFYILLLSVLLSLTLFNACGDRDVPEAPEPPPATATPTPVPEPPTVTPEPVADETTSETTDETTNDTTDEADTSEDKTGEAQEQADLEATDMSSALRLEILDDGQTVEVWVDEIENLAALDMQMQFDAAKVQVVDADEATEGIQIQTGEVPSPDFPVQNTADNDEGIIIYAVIRLPESKAFSGTGLVATITFEGDLSLDDLTIDTVEMADVEGQPIVKH